MATNPPEWPRLDPQAPPPGVAPTPPAAPRRGRGLAILLLVLGLAGTGLGSYILWYATRFSWVRDDEVMQALLIGGAGLVLLALGVQRLLRGVKGWIAGGATLLVPAAIAIFVVLGAQRRSADADAQTAALVAAYDRLMTVCSGTAVPEAAAYDRAPGLHPTAFFTTPSEGKTYGWLGDSPPRAWRPTKVDQAQLVACNKTVKDTLEGCSYTTSGGDRFVSRVRYVQELVLFEARTATELTRGRIAGSEPAPCPETTTFGQYDTFKDISGSLPGDDALIGLVQGWIEVGPGGPPPR